MSCTPPEIDVNIVLRTLKENGVSLIEIIRDSQQLEILKEYLKSAYPSVRDTIDSIYLLSNSSLGIILDSYNSCSLYIYKIPTEVLLILLQILGKLT